MKKCINCNEDLVRGEKYCSNQCQSDYQYKKYIERWLKGEEDGMQGKLSISHHIRKYLHAKHNSSCSICSWNKVNTTTGKVPLEINHINGIHTDNTPDNLELICPNCHSLTPTYKSLNKGKGRKGR